MEHLRIEPGDHILFDGPRRPDWETTVTQVGKTYFTDVAGQRWERARITRVISTKEERA